MLGSFAFAGVALLMASFHGQAAASDVVLQFGGDFNATGTFAYGDTISFCSSDNSLSSPARRCSDGMGVALKIDAGEAGSIRVTAHASQTTETTVRFLPEDESFSIQPNASHRLSVRDASGVIRQFIITFEPVNEP